MSNLIGVTFSNSSVQPIKITDSDNRPANITYFTFHSNVSANTVDCRAPIKSLALEFSLRLPQTLSLLVFHSSIEIIFPLCRPTTDSKCEVVG